MCVFTCVCGKRDYEGARDQGVIVRAGDSVQEVEHVQGLKRSSDETQVTEIQVSTSGALATYNHKNDLMATSPEHKCKKIAGCPPAVEQQNTRLERCAIQINRVFSIIGPKRRPAGLAPFLGAAFGRQR